VHLNANPTQGEILHQEFKEKKEKLKDTSKVSILAKYGGEEYLEKAPKELLEGQTEDYVEYSRTGQVIKGRERAKAKSKYPEDVLINNHTAVWGSWYDLSSGIWGYACCQSTLHISYCAGQAGIEAARASSAQHLLASTSMPEPSSASAQKSSSKPLVETHTADTDHSARARNGTEQNFSKKRVGECDVKLNSERLAKAISEEKKRKMRGEDEDEDGLGDRFGKKKRAGGGGHDVTEEELEAYRMNRRQVEDPMANYVDTED